MTALPQNNTNRLFIDYVTGTSATSVEHTMAVRMLNGVTVTQAQNAVAGFLISLGEGNLRQGWRVLRVRYQAAGTAFSVPQVIEDELFGILGTYSGDYSPRFEAVEDTFQGRSFSTGRRVDLSIYRAASDAVSNFRVNAGEAGFPAAVGAASAFLNSAVAAPGAFVCIDGTQPVWYTYLNMNYNSYWERRIRTS